MTAPFPNQGSILDRRCCIWQAGLTGDSQELHRGDAVFGGATMQIEERMSLSLQVKLASMIAHMTQFVRGGRHHYDLADAINLLADPEVSQWFAAMKKAGFLPVPK